MKGLFNQPLGGNTPEGPRPFSLQNYGGNYGNSNASQNYGNSNGSPDSSYRKPDTQHKHRKSEDHIASFRSYLSDLLKETDEFQLENEKLKEALVKLKRDLIHQRKEKLLVCFDHNQGVLMGFVFGEWKHETFQGRRLRLAKELEHRSEEMKQQMEDRLRMLEEQATSKVAIFQGEMEKMKTKHKQEIELRDSALLRSEEELSKKEQLISDLQLKLAKMDTFLQTVAEQSEAVKELALSARGEIDSSNPKGKHYVVVTKPSNESLSQKNATEFVKDSLHDILAKVDSRYMPRMIKNPMSPVVVSRLDETEDVTPAHATILDGSQYLQQGAQHGAANGTSVTNGTSAVHGNGTANGTTKQGTRTPNVAQAYTPVNLTPRLSTPRLMAIRTNFNGRPLTPLRQQ